MSSIECNIKKFHVVVIQKRQKYLQTRRYGNVYLGVVELGICEVCYVNEGCVGSAVVLYI